jgi:hypothetical protein
MTKAEIRREMAENKAIVYGMWIKGQRGNAETEAQRAERHALTDRWYALRRQLRAL